MLRCLLVSLALVVLAAVALKLVFGTLVLIGGGVAAIVRVVPEWVWITGAVAILIWAAGTRGQQKLE